MAGMYNNYAYMYGNLISQYILPGNGYNQHDEEVPKTQEERNADAIINAKKQDELMLQVTGLKLEELMYYTYILGFNENMISAVEEAVLSNKDNKMKTITVGVFSVSFGCKTLNITNQSDTSKYLKSSNGYSNVSAGSDYPETNPFKGISYASVVQARINTFGDWDPTLFEEEDPWDKLNLYAGGFGP